MKYGALMLNGLLALVGTDALAEGGVKYTVTFDATWTAKSHPKEYPGNAHFSGLIGATHGGGYALFRDGGTATDGLEKLSETGSHKPLDDEIRAAIKAGKAGALLESGPLFNLPAKTAITFEIDERNPTVSLVAMIAPSPDWFTGATVSLREGNAWVAKKEITLLAWDAGTDHGTTYAAADVDAMPRGTVRLNDAPHFMADDGKRIPVGTLTFVREGPMAK